MSNATPPEKLGLIFDLCDADKDGKLTTDELTQTLLTLLKCTNRLALSPREAMQPQDFAAALTLAVLSEADADGSGEIDMGECIVGPAVIYLLYRCVPDDALELCCTEEFGAWVAASPPSAAAQVIQDCLYYLRPR
jgi:hypothetical protein